MKHTLVALGCLLALATTPTFAQLATPPKTPPAQSAPVSPITPDASTPAASPTAALMTTQEFATQTRALEANPLEDGTEQVRRDLVAWVNEAPDVMVNVCRTVEPFLKKDDTLSMILFGQALFANATYQIEHPKASELDIQVGGLQGVVRTYANIQKKLPQAKNAYAEALALLDRKGGLADLVKRTCPGDLETGNAARTKAGQHH